MKRFRAGLVVLFVLLYGGWCPAQTLLSPTHLYDSQDDTLLTGPLKKWRTEGHYVKLLNDLKIGGFDCGGGCEGVRINLIFTIDSQGKLVPAKITESIVCRRKAGKNFTNRFYQSLETIRFPAKYQGIYYSYQFGYILKC